MRDQSALPALLERVRQATSADRDLFAAVLYRLGINAVWLAENSEADNADARLYERIMGMVDVGAFLDAALALCARVLPGWGYFIRRDEDGCNAALLYPYASRVTPGSRQHPTSPALALLAALVAAEMENKDG